MTQKTFTVRYCSSQNDGLIQIAETEKKLANLFCWDTGHVLVESKF